MTISNGLEGDATTRLADLRHRVLNGEEVSPEEYSEVLASIRAFRRAATPRGKGAKAPAVPVENILDEFV